MMKNKSKNNDEEVPDTEDPVEEAAGNKSSQETELPDFWNIIFVQGDVSDKMSAYVSEKLLTMDYINSQLEVQQPITMIINSPGGSLTEAWQICDIMDYVSSDIHTVGVGNICSAGLLIFMNGSPGNRRISDRCAVMSHRYSWGAAGKHTDLIAVRKEQDYVHQRILKHYEECTGLSKKFIEANLLTEHDQWLTCKEAVKYNLADSIVVSKKSKLLRKKKIILKG